MSSFLKYIEDHPPIAPQKVGRLRLEDMIDEINGNANAVVLTGNTPSRDESYFNSKLRLWCEENRMPCTVISAEEMFHRPLDGMDPNSTIVFIRDGSYSSMLMGSILKEANIFCANGVDCIGTCIDKFKTSKILKEAKIPVIDSVLLGTSNLPKSLSDSIKFPADISSTDPSRPVVVVESSAALGSMVEMVNSLDRKGCILQEHSSESIKVQVFGDEVLCSSSKISSKLSGICIDAVRAVGGVWAEVDLSGSKIKSINPFPICEGRDHIDRVMTKFRRKENWRKPPQVCGFEEEVVIDGIGRFQGKFNTGNGAMCSILAENVKVNTETGKVSFKIGDQQFSEEYEKRISLRSGGQRVQRCTVRLDVVLNETKYLKTEFYVDERKEPAVLFSRAFMAKAGLIVDPSRKNILTEVSGE